jgi:flagellar biosynthesis protein FlhB
MALPFSFSKNKTLFYLVSVFTLTHCTSLALSTYEILEVNTSLIEFLIPLSIVLMAYFDYRYTQKLNAKSLRFHLVATALFGLIHGFGFSNYFKMLMGQTQDKVTGLVSFAVGLELAQLIIITMVVLLVLLIRRVQFQKNQIIKWGAVLIGVLSMPLLYTTFIALIN